MTHKALYNRPLKSDDKLARWSPCPVVVVIVTLNKKKTVGAAIMTSFPKPLFSVPLSSSQ